VTFAKRSDTRNDEPECVTRAAALPGQCAADDQGSGAFLVSYAAEMPGTAIALSMAMLAMTAIACYYNSFWDSFVFDDAYWIVANTSIRKLWPIWQVLMPTKELLARGRPVINLTLAVNHALGGMNVWGYHAVNLALHVFAAWTLFGVVRRTLILPRLHVRFGSVATPLALGVALLWMIHPLQTESVTYIIQRTEVLVGLFYLLSLYCVIRGATSTKPTLWYVVAAIACLLGMGTKELMVTAPVVILLYDRTFLAGTFREAWRRRWGVYLAMTLTWGVVAALLISSNFYDGTTGFAVQRFTWWSYLLTQPGVIAHYIRLAFWPSGLCFDYGWRPPQHASEILLPGIFVVGLLALTAWALVKRPAWGFLGAWFFVILSPTSSFVPIQDAAFEHRMYLSLAAIVAGMVVGGWIAGQWLATRRAIHTSVLLASGGALVVLVGVLFAIQTLHRNTDYESEEKIWQDTVAKAPGNERAHGNLAWALVARGLIDEGIAEYQTALELRPTFDVVHNDLGLALAKRGRFDEAIVHHRKALEVDPDSPGGHNGLALALAGRGQLDEAIVHYKRAIELNPDFAEAYYNLGSVLAGRRQFDEAIAMYEHAVQINPNNAETYNNLGNALVGCGRIEEALADYRKASQLKPDKPGTYNNIGVALVGQGQVEQAIAAFRKAVELDPRYAEARNNLGLALVDSGKVEEAIGCFRKAVELKPGHAASHNSLGKALMRQGQRDEAIGCFRKALEIRPDFVEARQNLAIALGQDAKTK
jgi:protein O-mannosyl-transferase